MAAGIILSSSYKNMHLLEHIHGPQLIEHRPWRYAAQVWPTNFVRPASLFNNGTTSRRQLQALCCPTATQWLPQSLDNISSVFATACCQDFSGRGPAETTWPRVAHKSNSDKEGEAVMASCSRVEIYRLLGPSLAEEAFLTTLARQRMQTHTRNCPMACVA